MTAKQTRIFAWLVISALALLPAAQAQQFGPWSVPINLGPTINTTLYYEQGAAISKDGLSLYFQSNRPGGYGNYDLYVSQRASVNDAWGSPQNLGPNINTAGNDVGVTLSPDGHRLYFHSNRPGGFGGSDIYVSRRHNKRDDFGWQPAENLGPGVNTSAQEQQACIFEDEATGITYLYFNSNRAGGLGGHDIYVSELQADETFGPAVLVPELSSTADDNGVAIRRDGLEIFFTSLRLPSTGPYGLEDLWVAIRQSTLDPWSEPVNLGPVVNSIYSDGAPELSFDGTTLYFNSADPTHTSFDLFVSTRNKLKDQE